MRVLVGMSIFREVGEQVYTHSTLSLTLTDRTFRTLIIGMYVCFALAADRII